MTMEQDMNWAIEEIKRKKFEQHMAEVVESVKQSVIAQLTPVIEAVALKANMSKDEFKQAMGMIKIEVPAINVSMPDIQMPEVRVPEIKVPPINYTPPEVIVNYTPPPVTVESPTVNVKAPKVSMPTKALTNELRAIKKAVSVQQKLPEIEIPEYTKKKPIPALLVDVMGKPWEMPSGGGVRVIKDRKGLHLDEYDYVSLIETNMTDVYSFRKGGAVGSAVGGITIVYVDDSKNTISTVTRN